MRKALFIIAFLAFSNPSWSQQLPQYSQWYLHQFAINPAHAGIKQCIDVHTLYRNQWLGFEGSPQSGFLSMSIPLQARRRRVFGVRHGTGFKFESDQFGPFSMSRLNLACSLSSFSRTVAATLASLVTTACGMEGASPLRVIR